MKKIFMIAVMAVAAVSANAQLWIGGEIGFNSTTNTFKTGAHSQDFTSSNFTFAPEIGYNLSDNWAVAAKIGYEYSENNAEIASLVDQFEVPDYFKGLNTNTFYINPYARYTFLKAGNFSAFVDGGVAYGFIHLNGTSDIVSNVNMFKVGVNPGVAYAINPKVGLVAHIGDLSYKTQWVKVKDTDIKLSQSKINVGLWNAISFGAYYNF